jgi:thioredoxin-related protein
MAATLLLSQNLPSIGRVLSSILILSAILCCSVDSSGQTNEAADSHGPVHWLTVDQALEAIKTEPRKIMIDVYTQWCGPCKMLSKNTFGNAQVAAYLNANFYCVKFDAESAEPVHFDQKTFTNPEYKPNSPGRNGVHEFTRYMGVSAYPTIIFLDETGRFLLPVPGYQTPPQIELYLRLVAENHYQRITSAEQWEQWKAAFVPVWN